MPAYPPNLPQIPLLGASMVDDDAVARSSMDTGPGTRRNRFTAITQTVSYPMIFTGADVAVFLTFYRDTLSHGALSFDWTDPIDDTVVTLAFKNPPKWLAIGGGDIPSDRLWQTTFDLEILP